MYFALKIYNKSCFLANFLMKRMDWNEMFMLVYTFVHSELKGETSSRGFSHSTRQWSTLCTSHSNPNTVFLNEASTKFLFLTVRLKHPFWESHDNTEKERQLWSLMKIWEIKWKSWLPLRFTYIRISFPFIQPRIYRKVYEKMFISFRVWKHCRFSSRVICIFIPRTNSIREWYNI